MAEQLPVSPGGGVGAPQDGEDSVMKWDKFLERLAAPGAANSLFATGLTLLGDRSPGESTSSHIARGLGAGLEAYQIGTERDRRAALEGREADVRERQVATAEERTEIDRGALDVTRGRAAEEARSNREQEKIARERIAAQRKYYDALYQNAVKDSSLDPNDSLTRAFDVTKAQYDQMSEMLQLMDPTDPNYQGAFAQWTQLGNQLGQLTIQLASQMRGDTPAPGAYQFSDEDLMTIRSQPNFAEAGGEEKLKAMMGPSYKPPVTTEPMPGETAAPETAAPAATGTERVIPKAPSIGEVRDKFDRNMKAWMTRTSGAEAQRAIQWIEGNIQTLTPEQREQADRVLQRLRSR